MIVLEIITGYNKQPLSYRDDGPNIIMNKSELINLASPDFHESIGVLPKWRVGKGKDPEGRSPIYPYYDSDQCETIFDEVCGVDGWGNEFREVKGILFCSISIMTELGMIEKSDAGGARETRERGLSEVDAQTFRDKTSSSSAFVRTASKWGVGRHLDILPQIYLKADDSGFYAPDGTRYPIAKLSEFCNGASPAVKHLGALFMLQRSKFEANERAMQVLTELRQFVEGGSI